VRALERRFQGFTLQHILRAENSRADELVKTAANNMPVPNGTFYQVLQSLAIETMVKAFKTILITESEDWRQVIIDHLNNKHLTKDEASTARMDVRARNYTIIDGILYKKGVVQPLLRCVSQSEGSELLQEIHLGSCGSHIGPRALSVKAIRQGFYWPTHSKDVDQIVKTCKLARALRHTKQSPWQ